MACLFMSSDVAKSQTITVTNCPSLGYPGSIIGTVSGVVPSQYEVAIVINVFGTYWSKPFDVRPYVTIDNNSVFRMTFMDNSDVYAEKIHLFMVPTNSVIPVVLGGGTIPTNLYNLAVATAVIDRVPSANKVMWSGRHWTIKDTYGTIWGPGPNHFSASQVHIDDKDKLHLTISYVSNYWRCAELILDNSLGYGDYRFYVYSTLTNLPGPIVFGAFLYDDDPDFTHREIDFEFSNGAAIGSNAPMQYVIQPYQVPEQRHRFVVPWGLSYSTHSFLWMPEFVSFNSYVAKQSFVDQYTVSHMIQHNPRSLDSTFFTTSWIDMTNVFTRALCSTNLVIQEETTQWGWNNPFRFFRTKMTSFYESGTNASFEHWSTSSGVPPKGNEKVHINLWLLNGEAPGNTNESFEVVLSGFEFRAPTFVSETLRPKMQILKVDEPNIRALTTIRLTLPGN